MDDEADFGGAGDEPGAMPWPEPFTDAWRMRLALADAELEGLLREQRQLEKQRQGWPRLTP